MNRDQHTPRVDVNAPGSDVKTIKAAAGPPRSEGCSLAVAVGNATSTGNTVFFKQSDKQGSDAFEGPNYHRNQPINALRVFEAAGYNRVIGVSIAETDGIKMGMNEKGVAVGSTFSRTTSHEETGEPGELTASFRSRYMREALHHGDTATEAARHIVGRLYERPMASPGNLVVADPDRAIAIEGTADRIASRVVEDGLLIRTNKFELLDSIARGPDEIPSSYRRYERLSDFLERERGGVDAGTMVRISVDHTNGPGLKSICRHQERNYGDETSVSTAVFELKRDAPAGSSGYVALGKPCSAWRTAEGDGWLSFGAGSTGESIPESFSTGEAWKTHFTETPRTDGDLPAELQ